MATTRMFCQDANFCFAFWNNVGIVDVWGDLDPARMRKLGDGYRALLEQYPKGVVAISFIRSTTPVSSAEARAEAAKFLKELGGRMLHQSMVIEADGVLGLMLRSVVRGLNTLLRANRMSLHDKLEDALPMLAGLIETDLARPVAVRELSAAIAAVRTSRTAPPLKRASGDG